MFFQPLIVQAESAVFLKLEAATNNVILKNELVH